MRRLIHTLLCACTMAMLPGVLPGVLWAQHPIEVHDTIAGAKTTRQVALTLDACTGAFDVENHGENHIPAVIGQGRRVYGIPGSPDVVHLRREVQEGAKAITDMMGVSPHWYRGATLSQAAIQERLSHVKSGDVIIAHMNKPASQTAEGLSGGLLALLRRGFVFVRLDQVDLRVVP